MNGKAAALALALMLGVSGLHAQATVPGTESTARSLEWWFLDRPASERLGGELSTDPSLTLHLGGMLREQYETYVGFEFGLPAGRREHDDYLLHRLMLHFDLEVDDRLRTFVEFGNSIMVGNERPTSPVDEDEIYLHQAFLQVALTGGLHDPDGLDLIAGRQELSFGSGRLVSLRDGPNIRRAFDALRLDWSGEAHRLEVFFASEIATRPGVFDNRPTDDTLFWGAYLTLEDVIEGTNLDLYYLGLDRERAVFDLGVDDELRHSIGARIHGEVGRVGFNFEPVVQFGRFGDRDIMAWTIASDTTVALGPGELAPRLGLRANIISGGGSDDELHTFHALFPNNSYFSEAAIFAPANLFDLNLELQLRPSETSRILLLWDHLWRYALDDGVYAPPGIPVIASDETEGRYLGHSISAWAEWEVAPRVLLFAAFTQFWASDAVSSSGGRDVTYALLGVDWHF